MRTEVELVLAYMFMGLEALTRRDCGLILAGVHSCDSARLVERLLDKLEREQLVARSGGDDGRFTITETGKRRSAGLDPAEAWNRPWDGHWRVFCYDLPETRRRERLLLWRMLRAERLGLLQRSLWICNRGVSGGKQYMNMYRNASTNDLWQRRGLGMAK